MAVQLDCKSDAIHVRLVNSLTGEQLPGECKFLLGRNNSSVCTTDRVANAICEFNTGGLQSLITTQLLMRGHWDKALVFLLPNTVVPLGRFTDLGEHIVRDDNEQLYSLTLEVLIKKR